jgi:hypothetical protein
MVDVVAYNALKEYLTLNKSYVDSVAGVGTASFNFTVNQPAGFASTCSFYQGTSTLGSNIFTEYWNQIPRLLGATCGFKVCDTNFRCGKCCLWTVPAGITKVQFQIWGPGGSTGTNCCCGGAPFGPTGAYASVIMDVTASSQYTLCAGCAFCCYAFQDIPGLIGGASFVTGTGLTNFCAQSGISCVCFWKSAVADASGGCRFPVNTTCGPESCAGWNFCYDSANDAGFVYYSYSGSTLFYGTSTSGTVYGLPGMYPAHCVSSAHCNGAGFTIAAPIFGYLPQSQCCETYGSQTCAGCCRSFLFGGSNARMLIPGQGGYASLVLGGCNACGGDAGRMGMVCVRMC